MNAWWVRRWYGVAERAVRQAMKRNAETTESRDAFKLSKHTDSVSSRFTVRGSRIQASFDAGKAQRPEVRKKGAAKYRLGKTRG